MNNLAQVVAEVMGCPTQIHTQSQTRQDLAVIWREQSTECQIPICLCTDNWVISVCLLHYCHPSLREELAIIWDGQTGWENLVWKAYHLCVCGWIGFRPFLHWSHLVESPDYSVDISDPNNMLFLWYDCQQVDCPLERVAKPNIVKTLI